MNQPTRSDVVAADGTITIPPGYRWCRECDALTPHNQPKGMYAHYCVVCRCPSSYGAECPKCGYSAEDTAEQEIEYEVILHHPGCHYEEDTDEESDLWKLGYRSWARATYDMFFRKYFWEFRVTNRRDMEEIKCGCPRVTVFPNLHIYGHWAQQYYDGDWNVGATIRCPICGTVFEV